MYSAALIFIVTLRSAIFFGLLFDLIVFLFNQIDLLDDLSFMKIPLKEIFNCKVF